jgi:O-antigen/teichoic acid export membrane protein
MKRQILYNVASNYAGRAVALGLSFVLMPFLISKTGLEVFGTIVFLEGLIVFFESSAESFRIALSRYAAFSLSKGNDPDTASYLAAGRRMLWVLAAAALTIGLPFSFAVPTVFRVPAGYEDQSRILFALMTVAFALRLPNGVCRSGLYAKQRYDVINLAIHGSALVRAALLFFLFSFPPAGVGFLALYGWAYLATTLIQNTFFRMAFIRLVQPAARARASRDPKKERELFSFGAYTAVSHASAAAHENVIGVLLNLFWGPSANALYAVGVKFANLLESVLKEPVWALAPTFTALAAQEKKERVEELLFLCTKALTLITIPACLFLMLYAAWIVPAWVGTAFIPAVPLVIIALAPELLAIPLSACENFPNAYGRVKFAGAANVAFVAMSLASGYFLAVPGGMGVAGIVLGTSLSTTLYCILYLVPFACSIAGLSTLRYWRKAYLAPAAWAAAYWMPMFLGARQWLGPSPMGVGLLAFWVAATALYGWVCYRGCLNESEQEHFRYSLKTLTGRSGSE